MRPDRNLRRKEKSPASRAGTCVAAIPGPCVHLEGFFRTLRGGRAGRGPAARRARAGADVTEGTPLPVRARMSRPDSTARPGNAARAAGAPFGVPGTNAGADVTSVPTRAFARRRAPLTIRKGAGRGRLLPRDGCGRERAGGQKLLPAPTWCPSPSRTYPAVRGRSGGCRRPCTPGCRSRPSGPITGRIVACAIGGPGQGGLLTPPDFRRSRTPRPTFPPVAGTSRGASAAATEPAGPRQAEVPILGGERATVGAASGRSPGKPVGRSLGGRTWATAHGPCEARLRRFLCRTADSQCRAAVRGTRDSSITAKRPIRPHENRRSWRALFVARRYARRVDAHPVAKYMERGDLHLSA